MAGKTRIEIENESAYDADTRGIISAAFNLRREANDLEEKASALKDEANAHIMIALKLAGVNKFVSNIGTYRKVDKNTKTLDTKGLKNWLAMKGVDTYLLATGFAENTKTSNTSYVGFFKPRKKKAKGD